MNRQSSEQDFERDANLRTPLERVDATIATPTGHDMEVLRAARATAQTIRARNAKRPRWHIPLSMAASFVIGVGVASTYLSMRASAPVESIALTIPASVALRGASNTGTIRVEDASADAWYRYIQELIYAGDAKLAAEHLRRFNELHPDFEYRP